MARDKSLGGLRTLRWSSLLFFFAASFVVSAQTLESDLAVTKTGPDQSAADTDVPYTVTVFNNGPDAAGTVTLTDFIPDGMTFVSEDATGAPGFVCVGPGVGVNGDVICTGATLAAGSSAVFVFVFHIDADAGPGTFFTNIATAVTANDPNSENDSAVATTGIPPPPQSDVFVSKLGPSFAGPGTDVQYELTVGNAGPDAAALLTFEDTLPGDMTFVSLVQNSGPALSCDPPASGSGGTISCTGVNFPSGTSSTFTITGHIPSDTSSSSYTNTATVTEKSDPNPDNDDATTTLTISATDVSVVKSGPPAAQAGDISYTITVANAGPETATSVEFFDPLPAGTTFVSLVQDNGTAASCSKPDVGNSGTVVCTWLTLTNGASAQFTLVIFSGNNTSITNTATVSNQNFDTDPGNNEDSVTTTVTQIADLSIVKNGPATAAAGSDITYDVTVTNDGPSNATGVSVTDTLQTGLTFVSANAPAGWSCITPASGASGTITCSIATLPAGATPALTFVAHLTSSATVGSSISNTASVSAATSDPDSGDLSSTTTATVTAALPTDMSITKTTDGENFAVGATVPYTIVVTNTGSSDALETVVTDTIPVGTTLQSSTSTQGSCSGTPNVTCTLGTLTPGASATITIEVVLPSTPGTFINTASVTISNGDPNPANDASTATITSSANIGIPTLSSLALILLGMAFAVAGVIALRGRL